MDEVLNSGKSPIVVSPNYENMLQMMYDYSYNVVPYFIYRGSSDSELESWRQSLIKRGSTLDEIENREKVRDKYFRELYINHFNEYSSNVILNIYGVTTKEDIKLQFEGLCEKNDIDIELSAKNKLIR